MKYSLDYDADLDEATLTSVTNVELGYILSHSTDVTKDFTTLCDNDGNILSVKVMNASKKKLGNIMEWFEKKIVGKIEVNTKDAHSGRVKGRQET